MMSKKRSFMRKLAKFLTAYIPTVISAGISSINPLVYGMIPFRRQLAIIMVTSRCNMRCVMCGLRNSGEEDKELSLNEWEGIFRQLKDSGFKEIHFTGGEPLMRMDFVDLVLLAKKHGFTVGMTTNGSLVDNRILPDLIDAGLYSVAISIDAIGERYESIRGLKGGYEKALSALKLLARYKSEGRIAAYVNFTLMKPSLPDFVQVKKLTDSLGLPIDICLLDYTPYLFDVSANRDKFLIGENESEEFTRLIEFLAGEKKRSPDSLILTNSAIAYIKKYFGDTVQKHIPCTASQARIFINPAGKVLGGCLSMGALGDLTGTPLKDILSSPKSKKAHKNMFYKKCPGCSCGYIYNIRHHLPSILSDLFKG